MQNLWWRFCSSAELPGLKQVGGGERGVQWRRRGREGLEGKVLQLERHLVKRT